MKLQKIIFACIGLFLICTLISCSSPDEKANKLFVEASQLIKKAEDAEKSSFELAHKLYLEALEKCEKIPDKYPSSKLAVEMMQNDFKIGTYTFLELQDHIKIVERKAEAENDPLKCALLIADTIDDEKSKAMVFQEMSKKCLLLDNIDQAIAIANLINDPFIAANSFLRIANEYFEIGENETAINLVAIAHQLTQSIDDQNKVGRILSGVSSAYAKSKKCDEAFHLAQPMENSLFKSWTMTDIAICFAKEGKFDQALSAAKAIEFNAGDEQYISSAVNTIASEYISRGMKTEAENLTKLGTSPFQKAKIYIEICKAYLSFGEIDQALNLVEKSDMYKTNMLVFIAEAYIDIGDIDKALKISNEISNSSRSSISVFYHDAIIKKIAFKYVEDEDREKFHEILQQTISPSNRISTLVESAEKYYEFGDKNASLENLSLAQNYVEHIEKQHEKSKALEDIFRMYVKMKDPDSAYRLLKDSNNLRNDLISEISGLYAELGNYNDAINLINTIESNAIKMNTITDVINKFAQNGYTNFAIKLLELQDDPHRKALCSTKIGLSCVSNDEIEEALNLQLEALRLVNSIENQQQKAQALCEIGSLFHKLDREINENSKAELHIIINSAESGLVKSKKSYQNKNRNNLEPPPISDIEEAVKLSLKKHVPMSWAGNLMGGKNAQLSKIEVVEKGIFNEQRNYWPMKIRCVGSCELKDPFNQDKRRSFNKIGEFNLYRNDYGKWEATLNEQ